MDIVNKIAITLMLLATMALAFHFFRRRIELLKLGAPTDRLNRFPQRVKVFLRRVMAQVLLFRERPFTGMFHALVFWGFCAFTIGSLNHIFEGYFGHEKSIFFGTLIGHVYFGFLDFMALLTMIAILALAFRRFVLRPKSLTYPSHESTIIIVFIFTLMATYFLGNGFKFHINPNALGMGEEEGWMLLSSWTGNMLAEMGITANIVGQGMVSATTGYMLMWWLHLAVLCAFAVFIPNSKHMHLVACPVNEFLSELDTVGVQEKIEIDLEGDSDVLPSFGKSRIEQFKWTDLLDLYACVECGRCQDFCPAYASGKQLNPKYVILDMKEHLLKEGPALRAAMKEGKDLAEVERTALVGSVVTSDRIWDCTTCYACQEMCPVGNEHPQKLLEMRRYLAMEAEQSPTETGTLFRNLENQSNPWGLSRSERGKFLEDMEVPVAAEGAEFDVLLWVGCSGSYDQRAQKTIRALVKLLKAAGVKFAILGSEEGCCGDAARRLGNELLFQMHAMENIETMKGYGVKKIVTACPHGSHVLAHEYRQFGGEYEVEHYSVLLARLISEGKLRPTKALAHKVTYHDSCYLGRYHGIYDQPRAVVAAAGCHMTEMEKSHAGSFCCGGGGGRMFLEEDRGERINRLRTDQAAASGASTIAVACPFCLTMLEDGIKERGLEEKMKAVDLGELLLESLEGAAK